MKSKAKFKCVSFMTDLIDFLIEKSEQYSQEEKEEKKHLEEKNEEKIEKKNEKNNLIDFKKDLLEKICSLLNKNLKNFIPSWMSLENRCGEVWVNLDKKTCFASICFAKDFGFDDQLLSDTHFVNVGDGVLNALFKDWKFKFLEHKKREMQRKEEELMKKVSTENEKSDLQQKEEKNENLEQENNTGDENDMKDEQENRDGEEENMKDEQEKENKENKEDKNNNDEKFPAKNDNNNNSQSESNIDKDEIHFDLEKDLKIVVRDEKGNFIFRSQIDRFIGTEDFPLIPFWVSECVIDRKYPATEKIPFEIHEIKINDSNPKKKTECKFKLSAHPLLLKSKITTYISNKIDVDCSKIQLTCRNIPLLDHYSLNTIKNWFWKSSSSVEIQYYIE